MNLVRSVLAELMDLPRVMQLGLAILAFGGGLDLVYHASPSDWLGTIEILLGRDGYHAHLVTLAGMVITLAGLVGSQLAHRHPERRG